MNKQASTSSPRLLASRWRMGLLIASLIAILMHFLLSTHPSTDVLGLTTNNLPLIAVILLGGGLLFVEIMTKFFQGHVGADVLGVIAIISATLLEQYLAAILIIIKLTGGQILETFAMRKASSVLQALSERMPAKVHLKKDDQLHDIALADINIGDDIVVFAHETAPVDGVVVEGHGAMDEAYLTGEPYHVTKAPCAAVLFDAINGDVVLTIRAQKRADVSRYAQIMQVMQEAEQSRPHLHRLGDQIGGVFTLLALTLSFFVWNATGDALRFLAVLMIATPCPLIIAIPVTIIGAISMAARLGIVIKDPSVLERLPTCRTAIFDKTGTLTYGKPQLTEIVSASNISASDSLRYAASLEHYSKHPLAGAILQAAADKHLETVQAERVSELAGQGLSGVVDGHYIHVTHRKSLLQTSAQLADLLPPTEAGLECVIMMDHHYAATLRFRDMPRRGGKSFIDHLSPSHQFYKIMLVSSDRDIEVNDLVDQLGIEQTLASQSPEQKLAIVRAETAKAPTLFMGDGMNDAPALTAATVGIPFGQQNNVTLNQQVSLSWTHPCPRSMNSCTSAQSCVKLLCKVPSAVWLYR
jgi:heavy metal translocating P-type ATPase